MYCLVSVSDILGTHTRAWHNKKYAKGINICLTEFLDDSYRFCATFASSLQCITTLVMQRAEESYITSTL